MDGHDVFKPMVCGKCGMLLDKCLCRDKLTLAEIINNKKEKSIQYAIDSFNNQENYND